MDHRSIQGAITALKARGVLLADLPGDWPSRVAAFPSYPTSDIPHPTSTIPFPPTSSRTLASEAPAGIVIEGLNPPDIALGAWRATAQGADAFRAPLFILQADPLEFLAGLARLAADDLPFLTDPRCHFFIGPGAPQSFDAFLRARQDTALPKFLLRSPSRRTSLAPTPESILARAHEAQQAEHAALRARITSPTSPARWADRFAHPDPPLRILIPTTRYSTYVRHAAADLAAAFTTLGHSARTLEEPTTDSRLASLAYLRAALDFNPDLIVTINYVRAQLKGALPDHIPMVCWVQDRMPHLFDRALGVSQGPLDFLAGHIHPSLYLDFAYPRDRALFRAVPASPRTFHSGPVDPAPPHLARDLTCDVMYAGHQSETPDALRERLLPAFTAIPGLIDAARDIDARLRALAADNTLTASSLDSLTRDALGARNIPLANARAVETFDATYTRTLAERIHRHQTLHWAADICRRRNWRFHIHGNGWSSHPTLAPFARPHIDHTSSLRAAYHCARASLHASLATNAHQRIAECALSGGVMLRRAPCPDWALIKKLSIRAALAAWGPGEPFAARSTTCFRWSRNLPADFDSPDWSVPHMLRMRACNGRGRPSANADGTYTTEVIATTPDIERDLPRLPDIPLWTFPDYALPHADETAFRSSDELEHTLARAITDPQWRASTVAAHASIAREYWTTDRFAADLLAFLAERLPASRAPAGAAA